MNREQLIEEFNLGYMTVEEIIDMAEDNNYKVQGNATNEVSEFGCFKLINDNEEEIIVELDDNDDYIEEQIPDNVM
jgi:hypothetical protein